MRDKYVTAACFKTHWSNDELPITVDFHYGMIPRHSFITDLNHNTQLYKLLTSAVINMSNNNYYHYY